jgi:hypothetical protein
MGSSPTSPNRGSSIRSRLGAAACVLLASAPAVARADSAPTTQFEGSLLLYGEASRVKVGEPTFRVTRLYPNGQSLSAQAGIDVITGATPNGTLPSSGTQTTTSPSGRSSTRPAAGEMPMASFGDVRFALAADWSRPLGRFLTSTLGADFSKEKDYQSIGANAKLSADLMQRLTTVTAGAGYHSDAVSGKRGVYVGLTDGKSYLTTGTEPKRVTSFMAGISRIVTRRWMLGTNYSRLWERGYLTEPYKVLSQVDSVSGEPVGFLTEKRPDSRNRSDVLVSSTYNLAGEVLYLSLRHYWDDWGIRSNTYDLRYRHELRDDRYLEPHVRFYSQTAADFYRYGLFQGATLPAFASSDNRLAALHSMTVGATYGFRRAGHSVDWTLRVEYIRQWGDSHPADAIGVQRQYDLFPTLNTVTTVIGYSFGG